MTNLLDEAKCCEVIRQLRWPEGVVRLRRGGADIFATDCTSSWKLTNYLNAAKYL
jgi:hypothetical protein